MVDRVWKSDAAAGAPAAPASPSVGYPTDGNPSQGIAATRPGDYWYHMITEALRAVVVEGDLTPDHLQLDQVTTAVRRLAGAQAAVLSANTTLSLAHAGLVLVDASAGNVTLTLPPATTLAGLTYRIVRTDASANTVTVQADGTDLIEGAASLTLPPGDRRVLVTDGTDTWHRTVAEASETVRGLIELATVSEARDLTDLLRALTPGTLDASFKGGNQSLNTTGYQKLPGGLIVQWGRADLVPAGGTVTVTLPVAMTSVTIPSATIAESGSTSYVQAVHAHTATMTSFVLENTNTNAADVYWMVIGF